MVEPIITYHSKLYLVFVNHNYIQGYPVKDGMQRWKSRQYRYKCYPLIAHRLLTKRMLNWNTCYSRNRFTGVGYKQIAGVWGKGGSGEMNDEFCILPFLTLLTLSPLNNKVYESEVEIKPVCYKPFVYPKHNIWTIYPVALSVCVCVGVAGASARVCTGR